jgi:hypothetical protein
MCTHTLPPQTGNTQVMMAGHALNATLGSTRMNPAVLLAAHVPSTPTPLLLVPIEATANAILATQVPRETEASVTAVL